jgi:uncharacterized protein YcbK (DUF882 family)
MGLFPQIPPPLLTSLFLSLFAGLGLAFATTASGQSRSEYARMIAGPPREISPLSARTTAYLAGKQALVGAHASSDEAAPRDAHGRPMLSLRSINRGDAVTLASNADGTFPSIELDRASHFLRAMGGEEHAVDPRTLALVYRIQTHFAVPEIRVVSGYRPPKPGSHSNHGRGRAIDLIVPGTPDEEVARFVREIGYVGVGVYPRSQFVHVDIRPRSYFWVDDSGPHRHSHERAILGGQAASSDAEAQARHQPLIEPYAVGTDVDAALRASGLAPATPAAQDEEEDEGE